MVLMAGPGGVSDGQMHLPAWQQQRRQRTSLSLSLSLSLGLSLSNAAQLCGEALQRVAVAAALKLEVVGVQCSVLCQRPSSASHTASHTASWQATHLPLPCASA